MREEIYADIDTCHRLQAAEDIACVAQPAANQQRTACDLECDEAQQQRFENRSTIKLSRLFHEFDVGGSAEESRHVIDEVRRNEQDQNERGRNPMRDSKQPIARSREG